jgi:hypothetical protein
MNARDSLKPKSIRVAILQALADGAITTIDDLQTKLDEPRKKVVDNAVHASNDGLIKRMRDDVTGLAACKITTEGKAYLAKYASGKVEAQADVVEMREIPAPKVSPRKEENPVVTPGVKVENEAKESTLLIKELRAIAKDREDRIGVLDDTLTKAIAEKDAEISRLKNHYDEACVLVSRMHSAAMGGMCAPVVSVVDDIAEVRAQLDQIGLMVRNSCAEAVTSDATTIDLLAEILHKVPHQQYPVGYLIQCPTKPFVRFAKHENAKARALAFARSGKRAQVFALIPVGSAVPGAEWEER